MVEIYLDNQPLEVAEDVSIGLTVSIADIEDPTSCKTAFTKTIDVPMTAHNRAIMQHCEEILSPYNFNTSEHTVAVYQDGVELIKGKAYYDGTNGGYYQMQVVYEGADWINRIKDKALNEIDDEKVSVLTEYKVLTKDQRDKIFFGLINHGCWHQEINDTTVPRLWATYADLVPFISFKQILNSIFKGYDIADEIYSTESEHLRLKDVYITGKFKEIDNIDVIREDNTFEVSCNGVNERDVTVNGETLPVVGVVVDREAHGDEARYVECFDAVEDDPNDRITIEDVEVEIDGGNVPVDHKYLSFEPTQDIISAFNINLRYASQFKAVDNQLVFADTIHFNNLKVATLPAQDSSEMVALKSAEPLNSGKSFKSQYPETLTPNITTESGSKQISIPEEQMVWFYLELSNPELYTEVVQISWYETPEEELNGYVIINQNQVITTNISDKMFFKGASNFDISDWKNKPGTTSALIGLKTVDGDIVIIDYDEKARYKLTFYRGDKGDKYGLYVYRNYPKDYAKYSAASAKLYKFTDAEVLSFNLKLQTSGYDIRLSEEKLPLQVGFSSSNADLLDDGEQLLVTVAEGSTLSPLFNSVPPYGYEVSLNDVGGDIKATDVLKSIMQMFNMRIVVNPDKKEVLCISYPDFYTSDVVDWSNRIDLDKGISVSNIADSIGKEFVLSYQGNSASVEYYNRRHKDSYLSWRTPIETVYTEDTYELQSSFNPPMFSKVSDVFGKGDDTQILNIADKKAESTLEDWNVNDVPPTIVLVHDGGEDDFTETIPTMGVLENYQQPRMTADGTTGEDYGGSLSFKFLSEYYKPLIDTWNKGKRIECYCRILPQEIEALNKYGMADISFRSKFKLNINGEDIYCRLEAIENYEPQNSVHKCIFIYQ